MMKRVKKNQKFFYTKMMVDCMERFLIYYSKRIRVKNVLIAKGGKVPRPPPATLARQHTTAPHETPLQDQPQNATAHKIGRVGQVTGEQ